MKFVKLAAFVCAVTVLAAFSLTAFADGGERLYEKWEREGYPDDVGGVSASLMMGGYDPSRPAGEQDMSERVSYMIYVVNGTSDERKAELAALAEDGAKVDFRFCRHSFAEMSDLVRKIYGKFIGVDGVYDVYIDLYNGGSRIFVLTEEDRADGLNDRFSALFPDDSDIIRAVYVAPGDSGILTEEGMDEMPVLFRSGADAIVEIYETSHGLTLAGKIMLIAVGILAVASLATVYGVKTRRARVLSDGTTESGGMPLSAVKKAVAENETPSDGVYDGIMEKKNGKN